MSRLKELIGALFNKQNKKFLHDSDDEQEVDYEEDVVCEQYVDSPEEMIQEAIERMNSINMNPDIIADFEDSKMPQVFEPPYGASYYLEEDEEEMVRITEDRYHVLVWGIVRCFMSYNRKETAVDCMLTVSNNKNEWKQEREDLLNMNPFVYTFMKEHSIRDHGYINLYLSEGGTPLRIL